MIKFRNEVKEYSDEHFSNMAMLLTYAEQQEIHISFDLLAEMAGDLERERVRIESKMTSLSGRLSIIQAMLEIIDRIR